ncbi:MAG: hypothetical protein IKF38_04895 [Clostridia bacterium]|nr:hypothetical protein [Clostridia bacterium]
MEDKIENSIALHQENIEGFKQIKKRVEESGTEQLRIDIQTKHWYGFSEPILLKHHNKIEITKYSATVLLETAIKLEKERIDKLIDMEIEKRKENKANE